MEDPLEAVCEILSHKASFRFIQYTIIIYRIHISWKIGKVMGPLKADTLLRFAEPEVVFRGPIIFNYLVLC